MLLSPYLFLLCPAAAGAEAQRGCGCCFALTKRSGSTLSNAAVGRQKRIPLLPINAAAMQEEGRGRGGSFLFTD